MGDDERVVLRSPWRAEVLNMAPIAVVFTVFTAWSGDIVSLVTVAVVLVLMTVLFHYLTHVVLTPHAIELWRFGRTVIPWPQVGGVVLAGSRFTEVRVKLLLSDRSARALPAPRAVLGTGRRDIEEARDLVEQWWLRHRGDVVVPTQPAPVPGYDPWAPPPV